MRLFASGERLPGLCAPRQPRDDLVDVSLVLDQASRILQDEFSRRGGVAVENDVEGRFLCAATKDLLYRAFTISRSMVSGPWTAGYYKNLRQAKKGKAARW